MPLRSIRQQMEMLQREMDRLMGDFWPSRPSLLDESWASTAWPCVDETEDEKTYRVSVELPGIDPKDVEVTVGDGVLTISGEKKREEETREKNVYRREREYGSFRRVLALPTEVDESAAKASFDKGVLTVELPKSAEAQQKTRRIEISTK
ncbi:MAG TPA: Hsp20/alpha crystallin family protein [Pseudomonadales bacterium]